MRKKQNKNIWIGCKLLLLYGKLWLYQVTKLHWAIGFKSCSPLNWGEWNSMLRKIPKNHNNTMLKRHTIKTNFYSFGSQSPCSNNNGNKIILFGNMKRNCRPQKSIWYFSFLVFSFSSKCDIHKRLRFWSVEAHICPLWNTEAQTILQSQAVQSLQPYILSRHHSRCILSHF